MFRDIKSQCRGGGGQPREARLEADLVNQARLSHSFEEAHKHMRPPTTTRCTFAVCDTFQSPLSSSVSSADANMASRIKIELYN